MFGVFWYVKAACLAGLGFFVFLAPAKRPKTQPKATLKRSGWPCSPSHFCWLPLFPSCFLIVFSTWISNSATLPPFWVRFLGRGRCEFTHLPSLLSLLNYRQTFVWQAVSHNLCHAATPIPSQVKTQTCPNLLAGSWERGR